MATVPERIEAAVDRVDKSVHDLIDVSHARTEHFNRIIKIAVGILALQLLMGILILSATVGHIPGIRIFEHNRDGTAHLVHDLNCAVFWSNDKRVVGCERVYEILDHLPRN